MRDLCEPCIVRGNIEECLRTKCFYHHSWFIDQIRDDLTKEKMKVIKLLEAVEIVLEYIYMIKQAEPYFGIPDDKLTRINQILEEVQ